MTTLEFLGAAGTVTGSRFLVRTQEATVLVDAGLFQGAKRDRLANWEPFPIDPALIDAIIITHAHIDHSGWLPGLVRDGFRGAIFATPTTRKLCGVLLPDAAHLQEEQARFTNERGFGKHHPALPLYTTEDAANTMPLFRSVDFETPTEVAPGVVIRLTPAGHILGSSSVHLKITENERSTTLLVSGDLGRGNHPLIPGPSVPPSAETVLVESTYGDTRHPAAEQDVAELAQLIRKTAGRGGVVLIPAFAVDRTEVLLTVLRDLMASARIPRLPVYVDSPMALRVLQIYRSAAAEGDPLVCRPAIADRLASADSAIDQFDPGGGLHECMSVEESKSLGELTAPAIIISASGMASGGRVLHHLARLLPNPRNSVILCGFQAAGTRGRALVDGASSIKMLGRYVQVRSDVMMLNSLSVHADCDELCEWVESLETRPRTVFVVHGEQDASAALALRLRELEYNAVTPRQFERVRLP
ncbi:MAG: MBL fold metallo-hydrolase [Ilumatobacteraceae bacterium]|nr:MBL fold metallo-hydrolase [Ilumatobacteraceae bacterium]